MLPMLVALAATAVCWVGVLTLGWVWLARVFRADWVAPIKLDSRASMLMVGDPIQTVRPLSVNALAVVWSMLPVTVWATLLAIAWIRSAAMSWLMLPPVIWLMCRPALWF